MYNIYIKNWNDLANPKGEVVYLSDAAMNELLDILVDTEGNYNDIIISLNEIMLKGFLKPNPTHFGESECDILHGMIEVNTGAVKVLSLCKDTDNYHRFEWNKHNKFYFRVQADIDFFFPQDEDEESLQRAIGHIRKAKDNLDLGILEEINNRVVKTYKITLDTKLSCKEVLDVLELGLLNVNHEMKVEEVE